MKMIDILEENNFSVDEYNENGTLCGYEICTYTKAGVNQIIFLDFRDSELDATSDVDFLSLFVDYVDNINIDDEVDLHRKIEGYRNEFSVYDSLKDFSQWKQTLLIICRQMLEYKQKK